MPYLTKTWNELRMFENDDLKKNRESHFIFSPVRTNVCLLSFVIIIDSYITHSSFEIISQW